MKLNWGHGLALAMTLFILFIVGMAVKLMSQDSSVVYENYYEKGLQYDQQMAIEKRTAPFADSIKVTYAGSKLRLEFPASLALPIEDLRIQMYRPSTQDLDQHIRIDKKILEREVELQVNALAKGKWQARVTWEDSSDSVYFVQKTMFVE